MRLDKFLKISRLVKRRSVAGAMCDGDKVIIDGRPGKASSKVKEGNILEIDYGRKKTRVKVLEVPEKNLNKETAKELFEVIEEIWIKEI